MEYISLNCGSYEDFRHIGLLLTRKLQNQGFLLAKLKSSLRKFTVATMTWLIAMEYMCHKWPLICSTCRKHFPILPISRLITGFVTRLTQQVSLVEKELLVLWRHLSSPPVFSGVRVTRSLVLCVCFVDRCLSFYTFSFAHCFVCSSSIYWFWLPLWYLQNLLSEYIQKHVYSSILFSTTIKITP